MNCAVGWDSEAYPSILASRLRVRNAFLIHDR